MGGTLSGKLLFVVAVFNVVEKPTCVTSCPPKSKPSLQQTQCALDNQQCFFHDGCCSWGFVCVKDLGGVGFFCRDAEHILKDNQKCIPLGEKCFKGQYPCCGQNIYCSYSENSNSFCRKDSRAQSYAGVLSCKINQDLCLYNRGCCEDSGVCMHTASAEDPYCRHPNPETLMEVCDEKINVSCSYNMTCCGDVYTCNYHTRPQRNLCSMFE